MPATAQVFDVGSHHGLQRFDASSQTEASETGTDGLPSLLHVGSDGERA